MVLRFGPYSENCITGQEAPPFERIFAQAHNPYGGLYEGCCSGVFVIGWNLAV